MVKFLFSIIQLALNIEEYCSWKEVKLFHFCQHDDKRWHFENCSVVFHDIFAENKINWVARRSSQIDAEKGEYFFCYSTQTAPWNQYA